MSHYVKPFNSYKPKSSYICPHCGAFASHSSGPGCMIPPLRMKRDPKEDHLWREGLYCLVCSACDELTLFFRSRMVWPCNLVGPPPIEGMPDEIRAHYEEARGIAEASPRAAAALLRLAVQKRCKHLGEKGENINQDISNLVRKGLSVEVQKALDIVRVIGNNAVHPGQIDLDDSPQVCEQLFGIVNLIIDRMIIEPKKLEELFSSLPASSLQAIQKRDDNPRREEPV